MPKRPVLDRYALRPMVCTDLIRVGSDRGDGGYVVPRGAVERATVLLSLGLSDDWSFDEQFQSMNRRARVIGVDHSISPMLFRRRRLKHRMKALLYGVIGADVKAKKHHENAGRSAAYFTTFQHPHRHIRKRVGLRSSDRECTLSELINHESSLHRATIFVKMDIECSEYEVLPTILSFADVVECIVVEFHELDQRTVEFNDTIELLRQRYSIVHVHGNNYARYDDVMDFPVTVEITFLRTDLLGDVSTVSDIELPRPDLDRPNVHGRSDHRLSFGHPLGVASSGAV